MTLFGGNVESLTAIDMHVHLEPEQDHSINAAAREYFGESGAARDRKEMAEYYRSRKIGFVVFTVDEKLTGRPRVTNEEVVEFATANADIAIPFASIDPQRGSEGVAEAKRLVSAGVVRGLKLHPPVSSSSPTTGSRTRCTRFLPRPGFPSCFTLDTVESGPGCPAEAEFD